MDPVEVRRGDLGVERARDFETDPARPFVLDLLGHAAQHAGPAGVPGLAPVVGEQRAEQREERARSPRQPVDQEGGTSHRARVELVVEQVGLEPDPAQVIADLVGDRAGELDSGVARASHGCSLLTGVVGGHPSRRVARYPMRPPARDPNPGDRE